MKRADVFRYPDMKKNYFEMCRVVYLFDILLKLKLIVFKIKVTDN